MDSNTPATTPDFFLADDIEIMPSWGQQLYFSTSLHYQMAVGYDHWNIILGDRPEDKLGLLILGALPITNASIIPNQWVSYGANHDQMLIQLCAEKNKPLKKIISAVQAFELAGSCTLVYPVQTSYWKSNKIDHVHIKIPDNAFNLPYAQLEKLVDDMYKTRLDGESCYVHCKAGRGRSWVIVMAYLLKYTEFNTTDLAQAHVKSMRNQVNPSQQQLDYIQGFKKHLVDSQNLTESFAEIKIRDCVI